MTQAEFRTIREGLGLTAAWLAEHLDINTRTIERWEAGTSGVPEFAVEAMAQLEATAATHVGEHIETFRDAGVLAVLTIEPESDENVWPERWQRAIAFRVRQEIPLLRIVESGQMVNAHE